MTTEAMFWVLVIPAMLEGGVGVLPICRGGGRAHSHVMRKAMCVASCPVHVFELVMWVVKVFFQGVVRQTSRDSTSNKNSESKAVFIFTVK